MTDGRPEPDGAARAATAADGAPKRYPCRECGAQLAYRPGTSSLVCGYCGAVNEFAAESTGPVELDYRAHLAELEAQAPSDSQRTYKCEACRAEVHPPAHIAATACPYCGANLVALDEPNAVQRPQWLLPFTIDHEAAWHGYRAWIGKLWFAPTKVKRFARSERNFQGLYVPYWTYDAETVTDYTGMRGEHYWVTVGSGKNRRRERRTRWYPAAGRVHNSFDDVLVLASRTLPRKQAESLEPWDLADLKPAQEEYVSGFTAERAQVDLAAGFEIARGLMAPVIDQTIRRDIGGDEQRITSSDTAYPAITFKHILLPVWCGAFRFKDRLFRVLINARTGEVQGERPWSAWKIAFAILGALLVVGAIIAVVALAR